MSVGLYRAIHSLINRMSIKYVIVYCDMHRIQSSDCWKFPRLLNHYCTAVTMFSLVIVITADKYNDIVFLNRILLECHLGLPLFPLLILCRPFTPCLHQILVSHPLPRSENVCLVDGMKTARWDTPLNFDPSVCPVSWCSC